MSSIVTEGLLDTNLFIHAHLDDAHSGECRRFLEALRRGEQFDRQWLARYLIGVVEWPRVICDRATLAETLQRWSATPGLAFVDAYLATVATAHEVPVYTKNVREFVVQGVEVPVPLPS